MAVEEVLIKFVSDTTQLEDANTELAKTGKIAETDMKRYEELAKIIRDEVFKELKAAGIEFDKFGKIITKSVKGIDANFKSLKQQLSEAKNEAARLGEQFGTSSVEFKNAATRAGELQAELKDLNATLDALDPDAKAKAFNQFGQAAFGAFQVATGALQVFGIENEKVNKLAQQFQGFLNFTQGISQLGGIGDAFKNIQVVLGITTAAQQAQAVAAGEATVALEAEVIATDAAAASTKGLSASLLASPMAIFAVAAAAVAASIYLIDDANEEAARSTERLKKRFEDLDAARKVFDQTYDTAVQKQLKVYDRQIELAQAQGKSQQEIIALEVEKQKGIIRSADIALKSGKSTLEFEAELLERRKDAVFQLQLLEAKLTQVQKEELEKRKKQQEEIYEKIFQDVLKQQELEANAIDKKNKEILANEEKVRNELQRRKVLLAANPVEVIRAQIKNLDDNYKREIENAERIGKDTTAIREKYINDGIELSKQLTEAIKKADEEARKANDKIQKLKDAITEDVQPFINASENIMASLLSIYANATAERLAIAKDAQTQEVEGFQRALDERLISQAKYDKEVEKSQERLRKQEAKLRQEQAQREKAFAIFEATINGAVSVIQALPNTALAALTGAAVAAQIAAIASAPIPRFAKGTKRVTGGVEGQDSVAALVMPGEMIVDRHKTRKYSTALDAIYDERLTPHEVNTFARMTPTQRAMVIMNAGAQFNAATTLTTAKGSVLQSLNSYVDRSTNGMGSRRDTVKEVLQVLADSSSQDFHELKKAIGKNKKVRIENVDDIIYGLAAVMQTDNPRRR